MSKADGRLYLPLSEIQPISVTRSGVSGTGTVSFQTAYGTETSIMVATFSEGYHSGAHYHDSEQLNYVLEGELLFFINDEGFLCRKGDLIRVPNNALHWVWIRSETCTLLETQTPPLTGNPAIKEGAVAMKAPAEQIDTSNGVMNYFTEYDKLKEIEQRTLEKYGFT